MYDDRVGLLDHVGFVLVENDPDILVLVAQGCVGFSRDEVPALVENVVVAQYGFVYPASYFPVVHEKHGVHQYTIFQIQIRAAH